MNLLFTIDYGKDCMDQLRQAGHIVNYVNESAPARQLTQEEMDCDVIIGYNFFPKYPLSLFPAGAAAGAAGRRTAAPPLGGGR